MHFTPSHHWGVRNSILVGLPAPELDALRPLINAVRVGARVVLQEAKRRIEYVNFVESGIVSSRVRVAGSTLETALLGSKNAVGLSIALGNDRSCSQSVTISQSTMLRVGAVDLLQLMSDRPVLREHLLKHLHARMMHSSQIALCSARHEIEPRLASWLCLAHKASAGQSIAMTHSELSVILGLRRPSVTEALARFQSRGLIRKTRGLIEIDSYEPLRSAACACVAAIEDAYLTAKLLCKKSELHAPLELRSAMVAAQS